MSEDIHSTACTREMRAKGQYAADCESCEEWVRSLGSPEPEPFRLARHCPTCLCRADEPSQL